MGKKVYVRLVIAGFSVFCLALFWPAIKAAWRGEWLAVLLYSAITVTVFFVPVGLAVYRQNRKERKDRERWSGRPCVKESPRTEGKDGG